MKKTVRTYTKRTLSVFMAALMLLTAWVFVAPTASAATAQPKHTYRFILKKTSGTGNWRGDFDGATGNATIQITAKNKNGTSTSTTINTTYNSSDWLPSGTGAGSEKTVYTSSSTEYFPTSIKVTTNINRNGSAVGGQTGYVDCYLEVLNVESNSYVRSNWGNKGFTADTNLIGSGSTSKSQTWTSSAGIPAITAVRWANVTEQSVTVPADTTTNTVTAPTAKVIDQYGVEWWENPSYAFKGASNSNATSSDTISGITIQSSTATSTQCKIDFKNAAKTWVANSTNGVPDGTTYQRYVYVTAYYNNNGTYLYGRTYGSSSDQRFPIKVTNCKYTQEYNASLPTVDADKYSTYTVSPTSYSVYYGITPTRQKAIDNKSSTKDIYPQELKAAGYEFKGFYDFTSAASAVSYATAWSNPASTYTKLGDSTKLTAEHKTTTNNSSHPWYAAWQAKNVKVTYINNDGSVLKESNYGKYNQKASYVASGTNTTDKLSSAAPANPTFVHAPGVQGTYKYKFDHWEVVSAKQFVMSSDGTQEQVDYSDLVGTPYDTAVMRGDTVFQAIYVLDTENGTYENYTITYWNGYLNNSSEYNTTYGTYNYLANGYKTVTYEPANEVEEGTYEYEFLGWAQKVPGDDNHVYFQDWDPSANEGQGGYVPVSNAQTPLSDTKVYRTTTWVAVYGRKFIDYTINFIYTDRTETPDGYSYALAQNHEQTPLHYGDSITVPVYNEDFFDYTGKVEGQANNKLGYTYKFNGWNTTPAATVTGNVTYTAQYTERAGIYHIQFVDYDETVLNPEDYDPDSYDPLDEEHTAPQGIGWFKYGDDITAAEAAARALLTGKTYRDDEFEYTFDGWDKTVQTTAKDDAVYTAVYTRDRLYTVTYVNEGSEVATWKGVAGEYVPAFPQVETVDPDTSNPIAAPLAAPQRGRDDYAEAYTFEGWADEAYNPKTPAEVLVNKDGMSNYEMPAEDITLYAQYTCTLTDYEINFIYGRPDENNVMPDHKQSLHYGDDVEIPTDVARPDDTTYHYEFRGWDKTVSETCKGSATYTALYRKSYVYYTVMWYQPDLSSEQQTMTVGGEPRFYYAPSTEKVRDDETYIYNNLISAPYQEPNAPPKPDAEHEYVLAGWLYKDTLGNETPTLLTRADRVTITNHMVYDNLPENRAGKIELVPLFEKAADVKTVTFLDEDGTLLGTQKVPYGTLFKDINIGTLPAKTATETDHYSLDGWLLKDEQTGLFAETILDKDTYEVEVHITVKAKFSAKPHEYELVATTTAPTFFAEGEGELLCAACNKSGTTTLPKLKDGVVPTGRIKVKDQQWLDIADDEGPVLAAGQSVFIVNTADTAAATTYYLNKHTKQTVLSLPDGANPNDYQALTYNDGGVGSQVGNIYLYASKTAVTPEDVAADDWYRCFNYTEYHQHNPDATEANFSATVGDLASAIEVADGETFIIYAKIVDRGDPANVTYISTAKLTYDGTPPVITITSTDEKETVKHCVDATVEVEEGSIFFITKNGEELSTVQRTYTEKGEYTVIAYDEAGNVSRKSFEIIGSHSPKTVVTASTCTEGGEQFDVCRTCDKVISEVSETPPLGHKLKYRVKQPTCTEDGTVTVTCRRCGEAINDLVDGYTAEDGVYTGAILAQLADPDTEDGTFERLIAVGAHTWGDWEVKTPATCMATGEKVRYCTKCGEEDSDVIPIDENAHRWSASTYSKPATCTEPGETYRICRYNEAHHQHVADIEPTGHIAADEWVETLAPTCTEPGTEGQYCKFHGLVNGEVAASTVVVNTREVAALGHDFSVFVETVPPRWDGATPVQGYDVYKCSRCTETTHLNFKDPEDNVTVTFVVNGVVGEPVETAKGSTLNTVAKPDTAKASDNTYKYTFAGWKKAVKNDEDVWVATGEVLKDTFAITENVTLIATYTESYINYCVEFLYDTGLRYKIKGYSHWNEVITVEDPTKDADVNATYTFAGWKKAVQNEDETWSATGDIVNEIICKGDATYIAVFNPTAIKYTVIWADRAGANYVALKTLTDVDGGSDVSAQAPDLPASTKTANVNGHWVVTGWDISPTNVTQNLVIRPVEVQEAHNYATTNTPASCTEPAKTTYTCACGYNYSTTSGRPNGHTWTVTERVNPTATTDGYELRECSVCHVQDRVVLDKTGMINLKVTVKDQNGNPVSGVTVKVYDGDTFIGSDVSNSSGVATIPVPEAKTYRIVIEGKEGTVTVDANGRVTGGNIPTVDRNNGGSHGCDCTCHKSGFWPMIFRFFHKIIKMITGEFRCCPDANY
jgi:hypothetical protein